MPEGFAGGEIVFANYTWFGKSHFNHELSSTAYIM
jgi:hypothetical protein